MSTASHDYIIVGAGTAGCIVANRLTASGRHRVLLLEAGGQDDDFWIKVPAGISRLLAKPAYLWLNPTTPTAEFGGRSIPLIQGKLIGGSSSINGMMYVRGQSQDYDSWEAMGCKGWSWNDVLPYFKKVERDMDFDGAYHGQSGRIPVRRIFPELWTEYAKAVGEAFRGSGYDYIEDQNGEFRDGWFPITISNAYERRVSAAIGYLDPGTRLRNNLDILTNTHVTRLLFEGTKCVGVSANVGGKAQTFRANEVIMSCGAIHSPAHLLRAGIGPALELKNLGIDVLANVPGVGKRLMDHPSIALASFLKPHARMNTFTRRYLQVGLRYSSNIGGAPPGDMFVAVAAKTGWHAVGRQIGSMIIFVNRTYSETGQVRLSSRDWHDEPQVEFNLLSDERDLKRLMHGFRHMAEVHTHAALANAIESPFPAAWGDKVRQVGEYNFKNKFLTDVMARLLDGPDALRRYLFDKFIIDEYRIDQLMVDDEAMADFTKKAAIGVWHASCSCRMGTGDDPMAVVDTQGRVRGVQDLRVVDASIFPLVPSANTNFPTLMTAEKISDAILASS